MEDTFRKNYKTLSEDQITWMNNVKKRAEDLLQAIDQPCNSDIGGREIALAKTNLEQAVMWAVKGITK